ncbi:hypothetical protein HID58_022057 [Brassica napus]|uniref:Major facilitator superfamily (MFS) profile domain-containing protein n=1 Tax=Brassica napus TaxID=3708 RepID=A0ABQ8CYA9_BRANA|nr:hypothetical protein HID58_022057 [Brassica napus]
MNSESQIKKRTLPPRVLSSLDAARIQWYHFKAIIIAGMGLFTDAYDLFCIAPIMKMISHIYYHGDSISTPVLSISYAIALLGTATGQLVFGYLGDRVGRRRVYGLCLIIMILSSFGCGFSVCTSRRSCVMVSLGFFRFILGLGIGGDYPLSATIMSEFSNKRTRGAFIAAVFSMQGSGILVSSAVTMAVCVAFKNFGGGSKADGEAPVVADVAWRLILMIGALPAALTLYWRMLMPETARLLFCWAMSFYVESIACFNQFNVMKRRVFHLGMRDIILASPKLMGTSVEQPIFVSFFAMSAMEFDNKKVITLMATRLYLFVK